MSPTSTVYKADTRQVTPAHAGPSTGGRRSGSGSEPRMSPEPVSNQRLCYQESLEQRTDEVGIEHCIAPPTPPNPLLIVLLPNLTFSAHLSPAPPYCFYLPAMTDKHV